MNDEELKATRQNARQECKFWLARLRELDKERAEVSAAYDKWKAEFERCDRALAEKNVKRIPLNQGKRNGTKEPPPLSLAQLKEAAKALGIEI
jgi:ferric-dicitrate binding protein FerR (iron transport regulator)